MTLTAKPRRENHCRRMIRLLQEAMGGWVPCKTFTEFSRNHTARISELRNEGFDIECSGEDEHGVTFYRLVGQEDARGAQQRFIVVGHHAVTGFKTFHVLAHDEHEALHAVAPHITGGVSVTVIPCSSKDWIKAP